MRQRSTENNTTPTWGPPGRSAGKSTEPTRHGHNGAHSRSNLSSGNAEQWRSSEESATQRLSEKFNATSINEAIAVIFGRNPPKKSAPSNALPGINSPIQGQFLPTAHHHLIAYFAHKALGDGEKYEKKALDLFFSDIDGQIQKKKETGEGPTLDEKVLTPEVIIPLIDRAIDVLKPK